MEDQPLTRKPRPATHEISVLLVDDQPLIGEAVRRMLAPQSDITFHYCQDATEAVQKAAQLQPTVILQDLVMPNVGGLELVPAYRQQESTRDTPLIVLSTREEADTKAEAFARGANDYLVKLPDPVELVARIRYHSKGFIALLQRNEAYLALAQSEKALRDELATAANYVRSLLPEKTASPIATNWKFIPSTSLGGDAFDYQWLDDDHFMICLLDVCGHGVGSALLSVSVVNALRAQTLPNTDFTDPTGVLTAINRAFPMERQNNMFFTMWYGIFDRNQHTMTYSGGGHPPAILLPANARNSESMRLLESPGPLIGMDEDSEFPTETCEVTPHDRLFVYSDGVFELVRPSGEEWTFPEFLEFMATPTPPEMSKTDHLLHHARAIQQHDEFADDFSALEVEFDR